MNEKTADNLRKYNQYLKRQIKNYEHRIEMIKNSEDDTKRFIEELKALQTEWYELNQDLRNKNEQCDIIIQFLKSIDFDLFAISCHKHLHGLWVNLTSLVLRCVKIFKNKLFRLFKK